MKKIIIFLGCLISVSVNSQSVKELSRDWTSFVQTIAVESKTTKKFKIEASVRLESDDKSATASIWVKVKNKKNENSFFDNMEDRPVKSNLWKSYSIEGTIDANSKSLNFGGLCQFNGKFYFDSFKVYIENDKGVLELIPIANESFEEEVIDGIIPKWGLGTLKDQMIKIKEYKIFSDKNTDGTYSLLIHGTGIKTREYKIGKVEGASPQIGAMISMLNDLKDRVEETVKNMSKYELDYLHDEKSNRIGSLIMHLAAAEKYYQVYTFENREFNDEEKKIWQVAMDLDQGGRDTFKGHEVQYYLDIYNEVRAKTISELKKHDDAWFELYPLKSDMTNHFCWFHVMEHQSSHLGQILFLKKRILPIEPPKKIKWKKKIQN